MKNHDSRPTGATSFPKLNVVFSNNNDRGRGYGCGRGRGLGKWGSNYTFFDNNHSNFKKTINEDNKGNTPQNKKLKCGENQCFCCGTNGHWTRTCRTPNHLVNLYQVSLKEKRKNVEVNFAYQVDVYDPSNMKHLDVADFF